jgi:hypothetical protein
MVYELLTALRMTLTPAIATNLFTAIHTDTGSFRYSNVTTRTFTIAAALVAAGARPELVSQSLYEQRAPDALHWLGEALARVEVSEDGRMAWLALPAEAVPERIVEAEELVNYPRSVASVRVRVPPSRARRQRQGEPARQGRRRRAADRRAVRRRWSCQRRRMHGPGPAPEAKRACSPRSGEPSTELIAREPRLDALGLLVVDKGRGATSFDVVAIARRRLGVRRIGHAGTLDPDATGVLPILVGEATKLTPYLLDQDKEYLATIRFGVTTDTHDVSGRVLAESAVDGLTQARLEEACRAFVGRIKQVPPMYSAVHHQDGGSMSSPGPASRWNARRARSSSARSWSKSSTGRGPPCASCAARGRTCACSRLISARRSASAGRSRVWFAVASARSTCARRSRGAS